MTHRETGYISAPCNNSLIPPQPSTADVPDEKAKNSNLLVNVPAKEELLEKSNLSAVNTSAVLNASNTGTVGRNGTLCKKVYL